MTPGRSTRLTSSDPNDESTTGSVADFRGFRYGTEVTPHLRFDENCKLLVPDAVRFAQ